MAKPMNADDFIVAEDEGLEWRGTCIGQTKLQWAAWLTAKIASGEFSGFPWDVEKGVEVMINAGALHECSKHKGYYLGHAGKRGQSASAGRALPPQEEAGS